MKIFFFFCDAELLFIVNCTPQLIWINITLWIMPQLFLQPVEECPHAVLLPWLREIVQLGPRKHMFSWILVLKSNKMHNEQHGVMC